MEGTYEIRESTRAKRLGLTVHPDGRVLVTKPVRVSQKTVDMFVVQHEGWIQRAQEAFKKRTEKRIRRGIEQILLPRPRKNSNAYKEARKAARTLVTERLAHFNTHYGFVYGTISIRDQKTRWGSCSARGNLSFNYRIIYLPEVLQDYVVVHELCHTKEHNHSERFWALVAKTIEHPTRLRKLLRETYT